jgi:hypothetical protein
MKSNEYGVACSGIIFVLNFNSIHRTIIQTGLSLSIENAQQKYFNKPLNIFPV